MARGGRGGVHFTLFFAMENRRWMILPVHPAHPAHPAHPVHPARIRKWSLEAWSGASLRAGGEDDVSSTETPSNYVMYCPAQRAGTRPGTGRGAGNPPRQQTQGSSAHICYSAVHATCSGPSRGAQSARIPLPSGCAGIVAGRPWCSRRQAPILLPPCLRPLLRLSPQIGT